MSRSVLTPSSDLHPTNGYALLSINWPRYEPDHSPPPSRVTENKWSTVRFQVLTEAVLRRVVSKNLAHVSEVFKMRQCAPLKRRSISTRLHSAASQKTFIFTWSFIPTSSLHIHCLDLGNGNSLVFSSIRRIIQIGVDPCNCLNFPLHSCFLALNICF